MRIRTWDARRSRARSAAPAARARANGSSCPREHPRTVLSPRTLAPRRVRETVNTSWPVNRVAADPVVRAKPLPPVISRRLVIDGREPARWSRRYRPAAEKVTFESTL